MESTKILTPEEFEIMRAEFVKSIELRDSKKVEIYERVVEETHEFNQIPTSFKPVESLDKLSRDLLFFLEIRSFDQNGDTKVTDQKLCQHFKKSRSTIQRRLLKLRELGYINTIKKNFVDISRLDKPNHTEFFSDRIIRCCRIVVQKRFKVLKKLWKCDFRPEWKPHAIVEKGTGKYIDKSWLLNSNEVYRDLGKAPIKPKWKSIIDLWDMGIASKEVYEEYHRLNNLRYHDRPEGLFVLGYYKNRDEEN